MPLGYECWNCKRAAFYVKEMPKLGEIVDGRKCYRADGEPLIKGQVIRCQFCNEKPKELSLGLIKEFE